VQLGAPPVPRQIPHLSSRAGVSTSISTASSVEFKRTHA
jgi:hypothetical protein